MPAFFRIWGKTDPTKICVRDLRPGDIVPIGSKTATVFTVSWMDGKNGHPPRLISNGVSAVAMLVEFYDHEPLIAHPGAVVIAAGSSR